MQALEQASVHDNLSVFAGFVADQIVLAANAKPH
jgi:hypothetical protein